MKALRGVVQAREHDAGISWRWRLGAQQREMSHDAAVRYLDMTPLVIIAAAGFMALRYVSRGMGMQELLVMAGVGTSLFWVILYFARMMQAKR